VVDCANDENVKHNVVRLRKRAYKHFNAGLLDESGDAGARLTYVEGSQKCDSKKVE
jgi:hypothetical protein